MKFSFVLPAYKGRFLSESIQSILNQTYEDFELVVVDDCSPDPIRNIVSQFNDNRITYYRNDENIGGKDLVAQWNHCLNYAKGEYVILATDDDLYEPSFLSSFVPLVEKYPHVTLFRARILSVNSNNEIINVDRCYKEFLSPLEFRYHQMHGMKGGVPQYVFHRDSLLEKGGFIYLPCGWASDDATASMMSSFGFVNSQEHLARFRWSDINISGNYNHSLEKFMARLLFGEWLNSHPVDLSVADEWKDFYIQNVVKFMPIYHKQSLITTLVPMTWVQWLKCMPKLWNCKYMTLKDKGSVMFRSILKRI